ncbi:potassium channel family protein [Amycolatopsis pigmentata]|uniref:Potassium channel family protein n=1 Tax=Amycolatopsis pigmentata TaxID=450801 RepID=A0ABW5FPX4_9PSEU
MTPTPLPPGRPVTSAERWRFLWLAVARPAITVVALIVLYYYLPVDKKLDVWGTLFLVAGLSLVVAMIVWQVRLIALSPYPALQGVQALAIIVPLFLLVFANVYYIMEHDLPGSFTKHLTRTDALYFVVTVFSTVGFGDITAATQVARVLVTIQMVADLLVLGVVLRVIVSAVQLRRQDPDAMRAATQRQITMLSRLRRRRNR